MMQLSPDRRRSWSVPISARFGACLVAVAALGAYGCDGELLGDAGDPKQSEPGAPAQEEPQSGSGEPPGVDGVGWMTRLPRLSHAQWENTVRDLLRLDAAPGLSATFSLDPDDKTFDTFTARTVSANLWNDYQRAAETLAERVTGDPAALQRILPAAAPEDAATFVAELGLRAFRRPLSPKELAAYVGLFEEGVARAEGEASFARGAELVITALLQSPHFLYRIERSTEADGDRIWLDGYEIASRLSYALWNTMPSDELLAAAGAGELDTEQGVLAWARRMLDDERAADTIVSFHDQFFGVSGYGTIAKNAVLFPTFTADLGPTLQAEARAFVREVVALGDGGIAELLTSPIGFVNAQTAPFYGVEGTFGEALEKVQLDPRQRAGILTQLGFLSRYASQTQSDPILRGVHVSLDVLCIDLPPPPNGIPPLPGIGEGQTNRQRVEDSTGAGACRNCHVPFINPLGFAFEHYDAVGQWRDTDNGQPVDASDTYELDGVRVSYDGAIELSGLLAESATVHACYSKKWFEYVFGRAPADVESGVLDDLSNLSKGGAGVRELLATMTTLDTFRARPKE